MSISHVNEGLSPINYNQEVDCLRDELSHYFLSTCPIQLSELTQFKGRIETISQQELSPESTSALGRLSNEVDQFVKIFLLHDQDPLRYFQPIGSGYNGSQFILDGEGKLKEWVFKPKASERVEGLQGLRPGDGSHREAAAYLIATRLLQGTPHLQAIVPPTYQIQIEQDLGSVQQCINESISLYDIVEENREKIKDIPIGQIQRILFFNLLLGNTDANSANVLYNEETSRLFSIDHGGILSNSPEDPIYIGFNKLPQISSHNFDQELIEMIQFLNLEEQLSLLSSLGFSAPQQRQFEITYQLFFRANQFNQSILDPSLFISPGDLYLIITTFHTELFENKINLDDLIGMFKLIIERKQVLNEKIKSSTASLFYLFHEQEHLTSQLRGTAFIKLANMIAKKILPEFAKNHPRKLVLEPID